MVQGMKKHASRVVLLDRSYKSALELFALFSVVLMLSSCAGAGKGSGGGSSRDSSKVYETVTGSIQTQIGDTTGFNSWIIVLTDKATGISKVSEIDTSGEYFFKQVSQDATYTMTLLAPDFKLSSFLAMVSASEVGKIHQYFKLKGDTIPAVIHKGGNFEFSDPDAVSIQKDVAFDTNNNGIPDGLEELQQNGNLSSNDLEVERPLVGSFALAGTDTDKDGITNDLDPDIDGDGIANWFDADDDGNGTFDVFDLDANRDGVLDTAQKVGDHHFADAAEFIAVQTIIEPVGSELRATLKFSVKVPSSVKPNSVTIRGDSTLLDESQIIVKGTEGEAPGDIWNRKLQDDGKSFDGAAGDRIYGSKVQLKIGKIPAGSQVLFVQLNFGSGKNTWSMELPYTFTKFDYEAVELSFLNDTITLETTTPFGQNNNNEDITGFFWSVIIYDSNGTIVDTSASLNGVEDEYEIPSGKIVSGNSYVASLFAQSLGKVSGYPAYVLMSEDTDL